MGLIALPSMRSRGYDNQIAMGVILAGGVLGIIIPPSIPFVIYGVAAQCSISDLFLAGVIPGLLIGLVLMGVNYYTAHTKHYGKRSTFSLRKLFKTLLDSIWALLVPVIILGGIYGGYVTPTEAACVSVFYALIVCLFIYRTISIKDVPQLLKDAIASYAPICFLIGLATGFGRVLTLLRAGDVVQGFLASFIDNRVAFFIFLNVLLLILGMFMDVGAAVVILAPILLPVAKGFGIDGIHLGIVMVTNLAVGFVTPPFGMNLFVAAPLGETNVATLGKKALPFIACFIVALLMITFIPQISMCLL